MWQTSKAISAPLDFDYSIHSDYLIHWTGKDIDAAHDPNWRERHLSTRDPTVVGLYLKRLHDILKFGLWMTEEGSDTAAGATIEARATPKCCFTELKLSQSRVHAASYGRLGIGVKRAFLFDRFGRPLAYVGYSKDSHNDKFLEVCSRELKDRRFLNFFKPMNSNIGLNYDLYSESEWRILFFEELLAKRKIVDPRDRTNVAEHAYFQSLVPQAQEKLKYLVPLDGWFAMIIYPGLAVKNDAQWDDSTGIREQIRRIKSKTDHGNTVEGLHIAGRGNWPIEVDLNACRHF